MNAKELREKRAREYNIMCDLQARAEKESRALGQDEQKQWDAASEQFDTYTRELSRLEKWDDLQTNLEKEDRAEQRETAVPVSKGNVKDILGSDSYKRSFFKAIGNGTLSPQERNLLHEVRGTNTILTETGANTYGGYVIPTGFSYELEKTMKAYGGMLQASRIVPTPIGGTLYWPKVNDTGTSASWHTEGGSITKQDMTFTRETFGAHTLVTQVNVSIEWAQDESVSLLESELPLMLGERLGRGLNTALTTGDGSGKPTGIVGSAGAGKVAASATAFTADEIVDLLHSVDPAYRNSPGAAFMMHDSILAALKKLSFGSSDDRPLWQPSIRDGQPDRIQGYRYFINQDMASTQAIDAKIMLFGDFNKYIIRQVQTPLLVTLRERYMDELEIGFIMYARYDGKLLNSSAVKSLANAGA